MKLVVMGLLASTALMLTASNAGAWTCKERADRCAALGGGSACYDAGRCKGGVYTAPSGRTWSVDEGSTRRRTGAAQACLESCRTKMRAQPGFFQNPANRRYCKDKCGVP